MLSTAALDCSSSGMVFAGRVVEFCCVLEDIRNGSFQAVSEVSSWGRFSNRSIVSARIPCPHRAKEPLTLTYLFVLENGAPNSLLLSVCRGP